MKKRDFTVICAVLIIATAIGVGYRAARGPEGAPANTARITLGGAEYRTVPLSEDTTVVIEQPGGVYNTVRITSGGVSMESASCPDQRCVKQGFMTPDNIDGRYLENAIICLPNRVVIELLAEGA